MALDIIGAGYGRTGTDSLRAALTTLGYGPCHHMHEILENPEQVAHFPVEIGQVLVVLDRLVVDVDVEVLARIYGVKHLGNIRTPK